MIRLQTVVEDTNVTDANINLIINQGIHEVSVAEDWPFLQASTTIDLSDSTQTYALSSEASDFNRAEALVDDDHDRTLEFMSPTSFFYEVGNDTGNESTNPEFWTIWENKIYLSPIPSSDDTARLTLYYYKNPTTLSADDDTPEWDVAWHWILVEYGKWKLYEREEYFTEAERAFNSYTRYLADMAAYYSFQANPFPFTAGDGNIRRRGMPNLPDVYWRV